MCLFPAIIPRARGRKMRTSMPFGSLFANFTHLHLTLLWHAP